MSARVLAAQARSQYNEFLYRQILALADLERVTAGGFCPGLVEGVAPAPTGGKAGRGKEAPEEAPMPREEGRGRP